MIALPTTPGMPIQHLDGRLLGIGREQVPTRRRNDDGLVRTSLNIRRAMGAATRNLATGNSRLIPASRDVLLSGNADRDSQLSLHNWAPQFRELLTF